jgi:Zn-finger nucleic acid-binding protein
MNLCPRCHVPLSDEEYDGVAVKACGGCGGRWLDPDDLRAILDAAERWVEKPAVRTGIDLTGVREDAACPRCRAAMEPFNYAGDSGVVLDKCPVCGGLWLDGGDLERVLAAVAASEQNLGRDIKRFSADLHEAEVRQDTLEQRDTHPITDPLAAGIASRIADADPRP